MFATCVIQPLDMMKTRLQLAGEGTRVGSNIFTVGRKFIAEEGVLALYRGLDAGLIRQATYTTARLGLHENISQALATPGEKLSFAKKVFAGAAAGTLGAFFGNPADLALIRLQSDKTLPVEQRRNYKGVVDTFVRIVREEGVTSLWKGAVSTMTRACFLNVGMLATNAELLDQFQALGYKGFEAKVAASVASGFFASFLSLPFDLAKTRIQKQRPDANGVLPYKNLIDCMGKILAKEGIFSFWRGFPTYFTRIAPHVVITLILQDYLNGLLKRNGY